MICLSLWCWKILLVSGIVGLINQVLPGGGEDSRPLKLSTSLSSRIQWSKMVLIHWNINPTYSGKVSYFTDYTWDEYSFYKEGQIFSLHSLWQPTTEIPAQICSANTQSVTLCHFSPFFPQFLATLSASVKMWTLPSVPMRCQCPVKINLLVAYSLLNGKRVGMSSSVSKPEWQKGRFLDEWRSLCMISGMRLSVHIGNLKLTSFAVRIRASPFAQGCWWRPSYL